MFGFGDKQEQVQQQPAIRTVQTGYIPPQNIDVKWMFDNEYFLVSLKAKLYGGRMVRDEKTGEVLIKYKKEGMLMNDFGIEKTIALISGYVDKTHALSQIAEDRIMLLCRRLSIQLDFFFFDYMEDFDIDPDTASLIIDMMLDLYEMNMRKSMSGKALSLMGTMEHYEHTENSGGNKNNGGFRLPFLPTGK